MNKLDRFTPRFIFSCLLSYALLAVCSKSSFLYPMNDWVDVNCFFTVGRGILHGLAPYRDLYEQKGPLIYFVFALAALISENSFLGVYLLEGLCFACFLYLGGRIAETLSGEKPAFWPAAALLALAVPLTPAFSHGSSAEEFFLPVLALGLILTLKAVREKKNLTDGQGFVLGFCVAAGLWTKYTFCGLFLGLGLGVLAWYLFTGRARMLPRLMAFFLLGVLALSALVTGWFSLKGALPDLWQAYFVNNLSQYSSNIRSAPYAPPLENLLNNLPWSVPGALGLIGLALCVKKQGWEALSAWLGAVGLFVFTYLNGRRYPYYALVLAVFAPLGLGIAAAALARIRKGRVEKSVRMAALALSLLLLPAGPLIAWHASSNVYLTRIKKEDMPQYRFAEIIRQSVDQSLLNYGFLDGGFYYAAGVLPEGPYFCSLNIDLKDMEAYFQDSIRQGKTAFVITRSKKLKDSKSYRLIDESSLVFEGRPWTYYLYQRVDEP